MLNFEAVRLYAMGAGGLIGGVIGYRLFKENKPMAMKGIKWCIPISIGIIIGDLAPFTGMVALAGYGIIVITSRALEILYEEIALDEYDPMLDEPFHVRYYQYKDD